ncbi:MAG TPA: cyclase family protein, partial [bacterium]|nr:cyclase family protein [bacterium]
GREVIDADLLESVTLPTQAMLLLWTGYDSHFRLPDYYAAHPVCTEAFAEALVDLGVQLLGMDTPSPDREPFAVHKLLLGHEILIVENLTNLESLVFAEHFELMALPMKFEAEGAFVRVIAQID